METRGWVRTGRESLAVTGTSWMDHEFGSGALAPNQTGWDWFSIQLDDGRELMLYLLRLESGGIEPLSSGTLIERDGSSRHLARDEFDVRALGSWKSRASNATYPQGWRVRVAKEGLEMKLIPTVENQELVLPASGGVIYWEGAVRVTGTDRGRSIVGAGYVELTGYAGTAPGATGALTQ